MEPEKTSNNASWKEVVGWLIAVAAIASPWRVIFLNLERRGSVGSGRLEYEMAVDLAAGIAIIPFYCVMQLVALWFGYWVTKHRNRRLGQWLMALAAVAVLAQIMASL